MTARPLTPTETTTRRSLYLILPNTPGVSLSPNRAHGRHWADKELRRAKRDLAWATKLAILGCPDLPVRVPPGCPWTPPIDIEVIVHWESGRQIHDRDGLLASLKGAFDLIATELGVNDREFRFTSIEQDHDPCGEGWTRIAVREGT